MQFGAGPGSQAKMCLNASLGEEDAGAGLVERHVRRLDAKTGKSFPHLRRIEDLVRDAVEVGAASRAGDELTLGWSDEDAAGQHEQIALRLSLQVIPQAVGAAQ